MQYVQAYVHSMHELLLRSSLESQHRRCQRVHTGVSVIVCFLPRGLHWLSKQVCACMSAACTLGL
jgi:hypothetical protein